MVLNTSYSQAHFLARKVKGGVRWRRVGVGVRGERGWGIGWKRVREGKEEGRKREEGGGGRGGRGWR